MGLESAKVLDVGTLLSSERIRRATMERLQLNGKGRPDSSCIVDYTPVPAPPATSNLSADTECTDHFCTISLKTR
jgi:hypothetical protein